MLSACAATERAATCNTVLVSSPAILYMLGIIRRSPCDAVNVVASAPACSAPCRAPAAPPSLCISTTSGTDPQMFGRPSLAHSSASSAIADDGVIGKIAHSSLVRYATLAHASLPSTMSRVMRPQPAQARAESRERDT